MDALRKSLIVLLLLAGCGTERSIQPQNQNFVAWDATLYQNKPDLLPYGLHPLTALYSGQLWNTADQTNPPNPQNSSGLLAESQGMVFLDIENWPTDGMGISKYMQTMQSFQNFAPNLKFGFYSVSPIRDYWDALSGPRSPQYQAWQARNDTVAPIAQRANILFPSLYTFYNDEDGWCRYAIAQISEARRIGSGKPVYVFLWPQFEDDAEDYIPADFWQLELETARQYADGIVIWGGYQQVWDDSAPWWQETVTFLHDDAADR